jgi:predicted lipoprotein with Yx(FWY)xxD motif
MRLPVTVTVAAVALVALLLTTSAMSENEAHAGPKVTARGSAYGRILFDGRGFALYAFTRDTARRSACTAACAKAWPPYIVARRPHAGRGVKPSMLGTIRRGDGRRQATYAGKPLYYYVGDRKPLQVLCQNVSEFGGLWLVVRPNGTVVR